MNTATRVILGIAIGCLSGPSLTTAQTVAKPQGQIAGTAPGSKAGSLQQKTFEIVCRGGDDLRVDRLSGAPPKSPDSVRMGVYFLPPKVAAGRDGSGLPAGTCSYFGDQVFVVPDDPVGIWFDTVANARQKPMLSGGVGPLSTAAERFPDAETIPEYLKSPNHYWRFTAVKTNYGHFEATAHQHWKIGSERVLATARETPAERADLKPQPKKDATGPSARPTQPIQGQAPAGQAAGLKMDCIRNWPRISNIQGRITPGAPFTINGTCFGSERGYVEIIGRFEGGKLTPPFQGWNDNAIVVLMPDLTAILDHTIQISVRRAGDGKQSAAKQGRFVVARDEVEVPDDLWKPSAHLSETSGTNGRLGNVSPSTFKIAVNPACTLTDLDVPASAGAIIAVTGWPTGPSSEATVEVRWGPRFTNTTIRRLGVMVVENVASIDFMLKAKASCSRGFPVRPPGR